MSRSRRGSSNNYCKCIREFAGSQRFRYAANIRELVSAQGCRYHKVNLQSYYRHGTVEFRQHSGTLNAAKAVNWVRMLAAYIDESKRRADAPVPAPV